MPADNRLLRSYKTLIHICINNFEWNLISIKLRADAKSIKSNVTDWRTTDLY